MNPQVIEELLLAHGRALQLFAAQWFPWPEDCVQQAFIKLALLEELPDRPVAWLYRVVKHEALNMRRADLRRRKRELASRSRALGPDTSQHRSEWDSSDLVMALQRLDDEIRQAVVARTWGGLTFEEVGQLVGCSASAAHRRYQTGLNELRKRLGLTWLMK